MQNSVTQVIGLFQSYKRGIFESLQQGICGVLKSLKFDNLNFRP